MSAVFRAALVLAVFAVASVGCGRLGFGSEDNVAPASDASANDDAASDANSTDSGSDGDAQMTVACGPTVDCVCEDGDECNFTCSEGPCSFECQAGSRCNIECPGPGACEFTCGAGARCELDCRDNDNCLGTCAAGAEECPLRCTEADCREDDCPAGECAMACDDLGGCTIGGD